jgi:tetratricopeptide (TPR) repeat protein
VRWGFVLALCVSAAPARADFWRATGSGQAARQRAALVAEGDRYLLQAQSALATVGQEDPTPPIVQSAARSAVAAYERALAVAEDADVHYRAFFAARFIDDRRGDICAACRDGFEAIVRHADAVFRIDPRSSAARDLAFDSCLALSKLGGMAGAEADGYFERALQMYERFRSLVDDVSDTRGAQSRAISYSNAAELHMALGRLDEAIDYYRRAIETYPSESLHYYGLAVAYDRDGQWRKASSAMKTALELSHYVGLNRLRKSDVFFVPQGDVFFYLGLAHEVLGNRDGALDNYNRFLARSPGNRYLDRAREHIRELDAGGARK